MGYREEVQIRQAQEADIHTAREVLLDLTEDVQIRAAQEAGARVV